MSKKTIAFCLAFWLLLPNLILAAADKLSENTEFQVFKAQTELRFDGAKDSQQKDLQLLQQQLETQNKQIEGFDKRISDINFYLAIYAILATIVAIAVSVLALFTAGIKAKESAEIWFNQNEKGLLERLKRLESDVMAKAEQAHSSINNTEQSIIEKGAEVAKRLSSTLNNSTAEVSADDKTALEDASKQLESKDQSQYTFDDWNTRAHASYAENNLAIATEYWSNATMVSDATNLNVAHALFNKGVALSEQDKYDAAITCYDEVIKRFGSATETSLLELVTNALFNKGNALSKLNKHDEAITYYDEVIKCFASATETTLLELVANALINKSITLNKLSKHDEAIVCYDEVIKRFGSAIGTTLQVKVANTLINKGITLTKLNKYYAAIACYDEIIKRFGTASETDLQKPVAHALNGKGFRQLNLAKQAWESISERTNQLSNALNLFEQAKIRLSGDAIVLGNIAYTLWLLGRNDEAIPPLREALTLGGEKLRDAELKDTETHPIESVDAGFRDLVNKIWEEVQPR